MLVGDDPGLVGTLLGEKGMQKAPQLGQGLALAVGLSPSSDPASAEHHHVRAMDGDQVLAHSPAHHIA